tara:strand:+ start:87 stop:653 length:567 start_codon:yes stop_codon:yes gene_type:complete
MSQITRNIKPNDVIYTPKLVAEIMIDICDIKETDSVLDPSKGAGVFYDNLPPCNKDYCEITEDKDFFEYTNKVDLILGNPPYSIWTKWLEHTIKICDKFCYIFGVYNFTPCRLGKIFDAGFIITKFHLCKVDWWFSPSFIVLFEKGNIQDSIISSSSKMIMCECGVNRCGRGRTKNGKKYGMNECGNI